MASNVARVSRADRLARREKRDGFRGQRIVVLPRDVVAKARVHPLMGGLLPTDIGIFPAAKGHLRERRIGLDQAIFICCAKGAGWCELLGKRHEVPTGSLLVIPPGEPHVYGTDNKRPWTIFWFHLVGTDVEPFLRQLGAAAENPVVSFSDDPQWQALFEEALTVLEHGYTTPQLLHASRTLGHLLSSTIWRGRRLRYKAPDSRQKIAQCVDYMKKHIDEPLRLGALATMAGLSTSHFKSCFKQHTGYPCIDYFIRLRIHEASKWLDTTELSVKNIADRVGYADALWFSKAFHSITGVSPTEYRRSHKG